MANICLEKVMQTKMCLTHFYLQVETSKEFQSQQISKSFHHVHFQIETN